MDVKLNYQPRPQFLAFHNRKARWAAVVCHRRAGKTVAVVNDIIVGALECPLPRPQFAYIAPDYQQAKRIAWEYVKSYSEPLIEQTHESELRVTLKTGAKIFLLGAERADSLRGIYLDGAALDEVAQIRPSAISQVILPCLSDRKGWMTVMGTPKGKNHFYDMVKTARHDPSWYHMTLKASESGIIDAEELATIRSKMDESDYAQEYECSFEAALKGAIYGTEMEAAEAEGRIAEFGYDSRYPVDCICDLGYADDTVLLYFQRLPDRILLPEVYINNELTWDHYLDEMDSREVRHLYLPHDSRAANYQTGRSVMELAARRGYRPRIIPNHKLRDGIEAAKKLLPYIYWNRPLCSGAIEAMKSYHRAWDDKLGCYRERPVHDWSSHVADAVRYLGVVVDMLPQAERRIILPPGVQRAAPASYSFHLEDLFTDPRTNTSLIRES